MSVCTVSMSTIAATTTHHTPLTLALQAAATNELSPSSFALRGLTMHPDCLLLQKHGVTSPRLSPSAVASDKRASVCAEAEMSAMQEEEDLVRIDDDDDEDGERGIDDDDESEARCRQRHIADPVVEDEDDDDAVSLCSDGSVLSVGQEEGGICGEVGRQQRHHHHHHSHPLMQQGMHQTQRLLLSNVGDMMALCRSSAFSSVNTSADGSDARSSASTDDTAPTQTEDELSVTSAAAAPAAIDPFTVAHALRMPVPLVQPPRTNTSPFQEEFLRKSHIYAEELMKQQMQLMAAARASAFTLRNAATSGIAPTEAKMGFRSQPQHPMKSGEMPNFAGIHSHLSAISKMSQLSAAAAAAAAVVAGNQPQSGDALAKLTALGMAQQTQMHPQANSSATAISVSSLNQLQAQMQAHLPFMHHNNNNLNEPALKFSIDNILKADFGRRITDPLLKRGGGSNANGIRASKNASNNSPRNKKLNAAASASTAMDLTSLMSSAAATATASVGTMNFSNSLANICTNSNDSNSTAVSSNYGGASDFVKSPSSQTGGAASACSVSPAPGQGDAVKDNKGGEGTTSNSSSSSSASSATSGTGASGSGPIVWPAWVYCTRYSDRPSSGPRTRKPKKPASEKGTSPPVPEDKRPRTAFSGSQLARLKHEFTENRYLTEKRRQQLSSELGLNEAQIKIWFQNKRAKLKKSSGHKNPLALQLMAQGLYNHSTVPLTREEEELQELQERENEAAAAAAAAGAVST